MINIVGLGYGDLDDLTVGVLKIIKETKDVFINDAKYSIASELIKEEIEFKEVNELYNNITKYGEVGKDAVYALQGSISENIEVLNEFISLCKKENISYKLYSSSGAKEFVQQYLNMVIGEVRIINAEHIEKTNICRKSGIIITNIQNEDHLENVKIKINKLYNNDIDVYYLKDNVKNQFIKGKLNYINGDIELNDFNMIYIPENSEGKKDFDDLINVIEILRSENGCPWDKEQTHESIKKDIIEESYEVYDAIEENNKKALIEELGDVLFQVMFHASLGKDNKEFEFLDITDGICKKMIYRHPHVFGDVNVANTEEVLINWDELKKGEKNFESVTDELNGIAKTLPALIRAKKVQKKAKKIGFDFEDISGAIEKVKEELNEVIDVYKSEKMVRIKEEIGDLLFSCVNVSRFLNVDAEEALNLTSDKFIKRFSYMEEKAEQRNLNFEDMSLDDMDKLWDEAKKQENK